MTANQCDKERVKKLKQELSSIRDDMLELERAAQFKLQDLPAAERDSAINLIHYLALRRHDLRQLQEQLSALGLSSLGRAESHVIDNVQRLLAILETICYAPEPTRADLFIDWEKGRELIERHTTALLGPHPASRNVRIMVTMPSIAAQDYLFVRDLLVTGMDCMRINCAYDDERAWSLMIANLRRAVSEVGKECRVLMDLPGPKLRTGPLAPGPRVVKWRPTRDVFGCITAVARIWLTPVDDFVPAPAPSDACLPVEREWLDRLTPEDEIVFVDTRDARRKMVVTERIRTGCWAQSRQTSYVAPGTVLYSHDDSTMVGDLPAHEQFITLTVGDRLVLTRELTPGTPALRDEQGSVVIPARIGVTLPEIFACVRVDEAVFLDDGKIGGKISAVSADEIVVEITQARAKGEKLAGGKGINLPDSELTLSALTNQDIACLPFIAAHADMVGYSFVRSDSDLLELYSRLSTLGGEHLGIVLKIETRRAFEQLPDLLLAAMRRPRVGVMIARGDLAVECGYERMAEAQEEILWICEAAHVPVIWATQVLETLAKEGLPSRAEITDAAMGERAECVMLNKGPYISVAVRALDNILRRMQDHQNKKSSMLRPLRLADQFTAVN